VQAGLLVEGELEVDVAPGSQPAVYHDAGTGHRDVGQHTVGKLLGIPWTLLTLGFPKVVGEPSRLDAPGRIGVP